jgi:chromosomal replication initiation ATPase DnaA
MRGVYAMWWNKHVPLPNKIKLSEVQTIDACKDAVRMALGISFEQYNIVSRKQNLTFARQCFTSLVRKHTKLSFKAIGELFVRPYDHSSILAQCKNIESIEDLGSRDVKYKVWMEVQDKYNLITKWR